MIFIVSLSKESNVFDSTDTVEPSAWSIKLNKDDVFLIVTRLKFKEGGFNK